MKGDHGLGSQGRWEYLRAFYERYRKAGRKGKKVILREFCANTRYHRKCAICLLNGPPPEKRQTRHERQRGLSYNTSYGYILRWLDTDAEARCPCSG